MTKSKDIKKTLAEQILEKNNIPYTPLLINEEEFEDHKDKIYKTLALKGDKTGPLIAVIPITKHLSEKRLATASNNKKVSMLPLKKLQATTGFIHGANNPVAIWSNKHFPIYFDNKALNDQSIIVSAGEVGHSDEISIQDLSKLVSGIFADLADDKKDPI